MGARSKRRARGFAFRLSLVLIAALVLGTAVWCQWVYSQISFYATHDQAVRSDAIAVFGAAEYNGKPSPVFRARLDHARSLYKRGIAPLIVTLGGDGGDKHSEGQVGHNYLLGAGIPDSDLIAETVSRSTEESARQLAVIARVNSLHQIVVVSDATHLFRVRALCVASGLNVLTSPRPRVPVEGGSDSADKISHEILSYTLWRLHLH